MKLFGQMLFKLSAASFPQFAHLGPSPTHTVHNAMPLNIIEVVGMYGHRETQCFIQLLPGTRVHHARLGIMLGTNRNIYDLDIP